MAVGRTTERRNVASVGTTATTTALTGPAGSFNEEDAGRGITGVGIPAGATLAAAGASSGAAATLSVAATATGTITAAVGSASGGGAEYGFSGWSPETDAESESYSVAANNAGTIPPGRIMNTTTSFSTLQRARD